MQEWPLGVWFNGPFRGANPAPTGLGISLIFTVSGMMLYSFCSSHGFAISSLQGSK